MCDSYPTPNYPFIPPKATHSASENPLNYACDGDRQLVGIVLAHYLTKGHLIDMDSHGPGMRGKKGLEQGSVAAKFMVPLDGRTCINFKGQSNGRADEARFTLS